MGIIDINIDDFCEPNKNGIDKPFSIGDFTYATNGWVCVRVDRIPHVDEVEKSPPVLRLVWDHDSIENWISPAAPAEPQLPCKVCKGSGSVCICPECDGEGEIIAETSFNEYEVCCATCHGDGQIDGTQNKCSVCSGTGNDLDYVVKWERGFVHARHIAKIKELPNVEISTFGENTDIIRFRFDGGVGIVMPARGDD